MVSQMAVCTECGAELLPEARTCESCGAPTAGSTTEFAPILAEGRAHVDIKPVPEVPMLVVVKGPSLGEHFHLDRPRLTLGRDPACDVFLNDMTVSRMHANVDTVNGSVTVRDCGSLNGTYVNGVCIDAATLDEGDILQIGMFQMSFFSAGESIG